MKIAYMVVGVPCSGKSWVCERLTDRYTYVRHDDYIATKGPNAYLEAIRRASETSTLPLLIETPFSMSQIEEPLEAKGFNVTAVFILEGGDVLNEWYKARENAPIPTQHLSRQGTYRTRAEDRQAMRGTSPEIFEFLKLLRRYPWEEK